MQHSKIISHIILRNIYTVYCVGFKEFSGGVSVDVDTGREEVRSELEVINVTIYPLSDFHQTLKTK